MRVIHLLIYAGMCVGLAVLFQAGPLAAIGQWLPVWAEVVGISLLLFGCLFELLFFSGLAIFQLWLKGQRAGQPDLLK